MKEEKVRFPARLAALVAALSLAAGTTACGGNDDDGESGARTTVTRFPPTVPVNNEPLREGTGACGLVAQGDVQTAVGIPANPGSGTRTRTNESCTWTLRAQGNQLVAVVLSSSGRTEFERAMENLRASVEQLPGVGDRAFVANATGYGLKGDKLVVVDVVTTQPVPARKQAAVKLLTTAMSRA